LYGDSAPGGTGAPGNECDLAHERCLMRTGSGRRPIYAWLRLLLA
jgi:hypothetical protein